MTTRLPINTVIIPVAGFGTRVLPFTKAMPKVMLPLVDKPGIQIIVEEAVRAGLERIVFVTSTNQHVIEDHFDYYFELEERLRQTGKLELLRLIRQVSDLAEFVFVRQKEQLGNAHAVLQAKSVIGDRPFCVQWGDSIVISNGQPPFLRQLIKIWDTHPDAAAVLATHQTDDDGTNKYAIVETVQEDGGQRVTAIVEKPGPRATTSRLASNMGYLLSPLIFDYIERLTVRSGDEQVLANAIAALIADGHSVYSAPILGRHIDIGSKLEYAKGFIELAAAHPEIGPFICDYLQKSRLVDTTAPATIEPAKSRF